MELPFKYIILNIMKSLRDRQLPLTIELSSAMDYINLLLQKSYFTIQEKEELEKNFDFEFEITSLQTKYYQYIDIEDNKIKFDTDYADELETLIHEETQEYSRAIISNIDSTVSDTTEFLDIIGIKIRKGLYYYFQDIEKALEECYNKMCDLEVHIDIEEVDKHNLINQMKKLNMEKIIMYFNTQNLIPYIEQCDLMQYSSDILEKINDLEEMTLLLENDNFDECDIMYDAYLRSLFINGESYISNLRERLIIQTSDINNDQKYSTIKFYTTFLNLLEREIESSNELLCTELIRIKYRLMNTIDSIYDTALFINGKYEVEKDFQEDYFFVEAAIHYFIEELLLYDDEKYKNKEYDTENTIVYLDNIVKKLLIETYYTLTKDKNIIYEIECNPLYGVNNISSGLLKDIVDNSKHKVKEK